MTSQLTGSDHGGATLAAVSMAVAYTDGEHRELLQSIVDVARALLRARASSIFLLDEAAGELVFEAVSGEGSQALTGRRMPMYQGIAGWVVTSGEPMIVDDVSTNSHFARDVAESTGYVPTTVVAVPLEHDGRVLGALEVLDRGTTPDVALNDLALLDMFAHQAAISLRIVQRNRAAGRVLTRDDPDLGQLVAVIHALDRLGARRRRAGLDLISSLHKVLAADQQDGDASQWRGDHL
jgi:GAF domain-containing protein